MYSICRLVNFFFLNEPSLNPSLLVEVRERRDFLVDATADVSTLVRLTTLIIFLFFVEASIICNFYFFTAWADKSISSRERERAIITFERRWWSFGRLIDVCTFNYMNCTISKLKKEKKKRKTIVSVEFVGFCVFVKYIKGKRYKNKKTKKQTQMNNETSINFIIDPRDDANRRGTFCKQTFFRWFIQCWTLLEIDIIYYGKILWIGTTLIVITVLNYLVEHFINKLLKNLDWLFCLFNSYLSLKFK